MTWFFNGPGARTLVKWGVSKGLNLEDVEKDFEVEGTLASGLTIRNLRMKPEQGGEPGPIRKLSVGEAGVKYDFKALLKGDPLSGVSEVRLKDVDAEIAMLSKPEDEPEPDEKESANKDPLELVWKLLKGSYHLQNIDVVISREDGDDLFLEDFHLHLPRSGEGRLGFHRLRMGEQIDRGPVSTSIVKGGESLRVGEFELVSGVAVQELRLEKTGPTIVGIILTIAGGTIEATYGQEGELLARLEKGQVDLGELANTFALKKTLQSGELTALAVAFAGDFGRPASWKVDAKMALTEVSLPGEGIDRAELQASIENGALTALLEAERKRATLSLEAGTNLTGVEDLSMLAGLIADLDLTVKIPAIEEFDSSVSGSASLTATLEGSAGELRSGEANLATDQLAYRGVPIEGLALDLTVPAPDTVRAELEAVLDGDTKVDTTATIGLAGFQYDGNLKAEVEASERLAKLLATFGFTKAIDGRATLDWNGQGDFKTPRHEGQGTLVAADVRLEKGAVVDGARLQFGYRPESMRVEFLEAQSGDLSLSAAGSYENAQVTISQLVCMQGFREIVRGSAQVPFLLDAEDFFAQERAMSIQLRAESVRLQDFASVGGADSPVEGTVTADIDIEGTPSEPKGSGKLEARGLKLTRVEEVPPGDFALRFDLRDHRLAIDGELRHPDIKTLEIQASVPTRPEDWTAGRERLNDTPLQATVRLPKSSLAFVTGYSSAIKSIEGTAALDVTVGGTVGAPAIVGLVDVSVEDLKFDRSGLPEVRDTRITLRADAAERTVVIERFESLVSGGRVTLSGDVRLPAEGDGPQLNLAATAREALLARDADYNVRADADLKLTGTWKSARLSGVIALTNSRFMKEIDILPVDFPARNERSSLPEIERRPSFKASSNLDFGIAAEPFRDWRVDVRLVTKDAFLVRGNLARADAESDLRITGTGAKPVPNGRIFLRDGRLTLPFSKVDISEGRVNFSENTGFNGKLTVQAAAVVRQWDISIYLYGRIFDPDYVLTSDPPLPNEDIIALLATGTTRKELASGDGTVAASKAAQLFLKKLKQEAIDPDEEPTLFQELNQRTTVDIGQSDARTGERTLAGRLRLFRQLYLVASVSREGSYRGLLKYVFKLP